MDSSTSPASPTRRSTLVSTREGATIATRSIRTGRRASRQAGCGPDGCGSAGYGSAGFEAAGFEAAGFEAAGFEAAGFEAARRGSAGFEAARFEVAGRGRPAPEED
ncbi:hypothetical protein GCM10023074_29710 [Microbispora amethystogenes]|uniref:Uncharacterized protein n=1 Tax=Microbispora amethystogenes TaxID=1427754 RepID=A0ABQ4FAA5_9ACTN|nr:hypothetical protein Mam01_19180 [Microbispora amethystogenes]